MGAGAGQVEDEVFAGDFVDQKPVRRDMTFPAVDVVPGKQVLTLYLWTDITGEPKVTRIASSHAYSPVFR